MLARLNAFPSKVLQGRFTKLPFKHRICSCNLNTPDTIQHIILDCPLFTAQRRIAISLIPKWRTHPNDLISQFLLSDKEDDVTLIMAEFLLSVYKFKLINVL